MVVYPVGAPRSQAMRSTIKGHVVPLWTERSGLDHQTGVRHAALAVDGVHLHEWHLRASHHAERCGRQAVIKAILIWIIGSNCLP